jgi:hypothetical protein
VFLQASLLCLIFLDTSDTIRISVRAPIAGSAAKPIKLLRMTASMLDYFVLYIMLSFCEITRHLYALTLASPGTVIDVLQILLDNWYHVERPTITVSCARCLDEGVNVAEFGLQDAQAEAARGNYFITCARSVSLRASILLVSCFVLFLSEPSNTLVLAHYVCSSCSIPCAWTLLCQTSRWPIFRMV